MSGKRMSQTICASVPTDIVHNCTGCWKYRWSMLRSQYKGERSSSWVTNYYWQRHIMAFSQFLLMVQREDLPRAFLSRRVTVLVPTDQVSRQPHQHYRYDIIIIIIKEHHHHHYHHIYQHWQHHHHHQHDKHHHQAMAEYRGRRGEDLALNHFVNSIVVEEQVLIMLSMIIIYI